MEMLIDKNDAFRHNVCKKLAQLGKVIFTLTAAQRDREDEMRDVSLNYEEQISKIFERHKTKTDNIQKATAQKRKDYISKKKKKGGWLPFVPTPYIYINEKNNFEN